MALPSDRTSQDVASAFNRPQRQAVDAQTLTSQMHTSWLSRIGLLTMGSNAPEVISTPLPQQCSLVESVTLCDTTLSAFDLTIELPDAGNMPGFIKTFVHIGGIYAARITPSSNPALAQILRNPGDTCSYIWEISIGWCLYARPNSDNVAYNGISTFTADPLPTPVTILDSDGYCVLDISAAGADWSVFLPQIGTDAQILHIELRDYSAVPGTWGALLTPFIGDRILGETDDPNPGAIFFPLQVLAGQSVSCYLVADTTTAPKRWTNFSMLPPGSGGGGGGTVTSVAFVSPLNGFAAAVATPTTTPTVTLSTTVNGMVKGNGTALLAATAGTDYSAGTAALASGLVYSTTGTGAFSIVGLPLVVGNGGTGASAFADVNSIAVTNATATALGTLTSGALGEVLTSAGPGNPLTWSAPSGGTVTSISVATANGLAGLSSGGATPTLTLSTTVTGMVKGNGTTLSAATAGTDYSDGTALLGTGIVKTTTGTGALTVAVPADFPTLNQNTTGTASNVTGVVAVLNGGTNASSFADIRSLVITDATSSQLVTLTSGAIGEVLTSAGPGNPLTWAAPSGGTVTSISVLTANGLAGTSSGGVTPALTLSTTVTGMVKGNGTALLAAISGTDYSDGTALLGTGILKSTTGTGALTIAVPADFPILNQNTTGTSSNVTGVVAVLNGGTNASSFADNRSLVITDATSTQLVTLTSGALGEVLTSAGPGNPLTWAAPSGGTVTSISVASANGLAGTSSGGATPTLTLSTTVTGMVKGNGTALSAAVAGTDYSDGTALLGTGILKSTTGTGALSIAVPADFPILNQNTTGNAATVTTNANLTGPVTSVGNATAVTPLAITNAMIANTTIDLTSKVTGLLPGSNMAVFTPTTAGAVPNPASVGATFYLDGSGTFSVPPGSGGTVTSVSMLTANGFSGSVATATTTPAISVSADPSLATGIVKVTTGTGAISTAIAADFPVLNQNTTGNAATVTTNANLTGPVTSVGNATAVTPLAITNAMIANTTIDLTSKVTGLLPGSNMAVFTPTTAGAVPNPASVGATFYLDGSGAFSVPVGSGGTVTAVSVLTANGLAGTSSGGATPALTLSTTVTGMVKGNGTALSAAVSGTDYSDGTALLGTGILKSTTGTGALTIAVPADFPILNQNTTGTASNVTGIVAVANGGTNVASFADNNSLVVTNGTATSLATLTSGAPGDVLTSAGAGLPLTWSPVAVGGTVTSVSVTTANGFAGTVATATTTPAISISVDPALPSGVLYTTTGTGVVTIATNAQLPTMTSTVGGAVPTPPNNTTTHLLGNGTFGTFDPLTLTVATPATPAAGAVTLFRKPLTTARQMLGIIEPTGYSYNVQPFLGTQQIARWNPPGNSTTVPGINGMAAFITQGALAARIVATTNMFTRQRRLGYVSTAVAGALAGPRLALLQYTTGTGTGLGGFTVIIHFGFFASVAVRGAAADRAFVGMRNVTTAGTNVEPSTLTNCVGVGFRAADTNLHLFHGGTAAQAPINLGFALAGGVNVNWYRLALFSPANVTGTIHYEVTQLNTGTVVNGTLSGAGTVVPISTTLLTPINVYHTNNATAQIVGVDIGPVYVETRLP